jgi:histidyl-tRNA synthetase
MALMSDKTKQIKLSTEAYKGVRDFFPAEMAIEKHIFNIWRSVCEKYGYEEYTASVLEPAELYRAKSGEEIVNEQTYTFTDRGDREVTLRPEMTPTVARMVAARKRELVFPVRWFSIPNLFRYENPQRGRVREHWQLNVDIFGVESIQAEVETMQMAYEITKLYGLKDENFEIKVNNRKLMNFIMKDMLSLGDDAAYKLSKLIDKKDKIKAEQFDITAKEIIGAKADSFISLINAKNFAELKKNLGDTGAAHESLTEISTVIDGLAKLGITNVRFDQTLMRGFDYYTGIVFEVFDLNPANRRSVFGGGRYDDLLSLFGGEKVPAVGFGAGDVVAKDLMETYGTLPKTLGSSAKICICTMGEHNLVYSLALAKKIRDAGTSVVVDMSDKKIGDQIKNAVKRGVQKVIVIGDEEVKSGKLKIKDLATSKEEAFPNA